MIKVIKSNGKEETYDAEKIHKKTLIAVKGLNCSASEIEMNADLSIHNGIKTSEIHENLINSAAMLISEDFPDYEIASARLLNMKLRKEVYNQFEPKPFLDEVKKRVKKGFYDKSLFEKYTEEEISYFGSKLDFKKDEKFTYTALLQLSNKYLLKRNNKIIETPQEIFMLMNMYIFQDYPKDKRKKWILEGYRILSNFEASLPTPVMNGLRTPYKRFISCNVIDAGDTTKSLALANAFIMMMTANKSGIGLNGGAIRGLGADIDNGRVKHTGILPILKAFEKSTKALTQESRGGSSNINYPFFHYEIELIMELGNSKGTEDTRVRHSDHTIIFNKLFFKRVLLNEDITLFHMNEVPGLYENIGYPDKFEELYLKYEKTVSNKHKKTISVKEFIDKFVDERFLQGRLYYTIADNFQQQGPWKIPVYITNLCVEIFTPCKPLDKENAELSVCILAGINHGYTSDKRIPIVSEWLVRFLDSMIDYMDYTHKEIENPAKLRRTIGIGDSDIFHFLAKNKVFYNTVEGRNLLHKRLELTAFNLHKASIQLAKEFGKAEKLDDTKYSDGWFPIDSYNKNIDELVSVKLEQDWNSLREDLKKYGQRHSTLKANPPFGNSAKVSNSTSGIEPPKFLATKKNDKKVVVQIVPEYKKYKNYYTTAWSPEFNNKDYFKFVAICQKFTDQSISTNEYINLLNYKDNKVPSGELKENIFIAWKYGLKSMYYQNFKTNNDKDGLSDEEIGCSGGGCVV